MADPETEPQASPLPTYPAELQPFYTAVGQVMVGQQPLLDRLLIGILCDGHVLLEGVPGLAKTTAVRTVAQALALQFSRVQFTPDLLPADVVGTQIYQPANGQFSLKRGPVFTNVLLADEINRAPAKVQSALLEAMEERQVTIGEETMRLPEPFFVLATQNPIEQEGTYPLPEAQVDRFLLKIHVDYPSRDEELAIVDRVGGLKRLAAIEPVIDKDQLAELRGKVDSVFVDAKVKQYIIDVVRATRSPQEYGLPLSGLIRYGASPRGTVALLRVAKASAYLHGRDFVTPDDVKRLAPDVLRHRILLDYQAEVEAMTPDKLIDQLLSGLPVP